MCRTCEEDPRIAVLRARIRFLEGIFSIGDNTVYSPDVIAIEYLKCSLAVAVHV